MNRTLCADKPFTTEAPDAIRELAKIGDQRTTARHVGTIIIAAFLSNRKTPSVNFKIRSVMAAG